MLFAGKSNDFKDSIPRPLPAVPKTDCNRCGKPKRAWIVKPKLNPDTNEVIRQILDPDRAVYLVWYNGEGQLVGETAREMMTQIKSITLNDGTVMPIEHLAGIMGEHWATCPAVKEPEKFQHRRGRGYRR